MTAIVYLATNRVNGNRYIGATGKLLCQRRAHHYCVARAGTGHCKKFHAAIRKHGEKSFDWEVIFRAASYEEALREEVRLIAELRPEYNLTAGGEGTAGIVRSPETIAKHRVSRAGWRPTDEQRRRQSEAMKGRQFSEETRQKLSAAAKNRIYSESELEKRRETQRSRAGWRHTDDSRAKMSATRKGRPRPEWVIAKIVAARYANAGRPQYWGA